MSGIGSALIGAAGGMLGMIGQNARAKKAHGRNMDLMGIQYTNQRQLNKQGHELQMDMWNKTNYEAQMKHLKGAGLNAGLMYGMSGGGGTTAGSQGGGSAAAGTGQQPMDIGSSVNAAMAASQIKLQESQAEKNTAETKKISGVDTDLVSQQGKKVYNEIELMGYDRARKEMENQIQSYEVKAMRQNEETWMSSKVGQWQMDAIKVEAEKMGIKLTEERTTQIQHKIWQDWVNAGSGVLASASFITGAIKKLSKGK